MTGRASQLVPRRLLAALEERERTFEQQTAGFHAQLERELRFERHDDSIDEGTTIAQSITNSLSTRAQTLPFEQAFHTWRRNHLIEVFRRARITFERDWDQDLMIRYIRLMAIHRRLGHMRLAVNVWRAFRLDQVRNDDEVVLEVELKAFLLLGMIDQVAGENDAYRRANI